MKLKQEVEPYIPAPALRANKCCIVRGGGGRCKALGCRIYKRLRRRRRHNNSSERYQKKSTASGTFFSRPPPPFLLFSPLYTIPRHQTISPSISARREQLPIVRWSDVFFLSLSLSSSFGAYRKFGIQQFFIPAMCQSLNGILYSYKLRHFFYKKEKIIYLFFCSLIQVVRVNGRSDKL